MLHNLMLIALYLHLLYLPRVCVYVIYDELFTKAIYSKELQGALLIG